MKQQTANEIRQHAVTDYPREACGLVAVIRGKERYLPCRNVADNPQSDFVIHPEDLARAEDLGTIMAVVHSHPDGGAVLSEADRVQCAAWGWPWYIISVNAEGETSAITKHEPVEYVAPLVGREFSHGVLDCYTLIRDYYKRELQIELPDFVRADNWWNNNENLYMDHFGEAGFDPIKGAVRKHDVILMQVRSPVPNHAGVFLGDPDLMLHHMHGRLSTRDVYGGYYQEITRVIIRHRELQQ